MNDATAPHRRYALSFTSGGLLVRESSVALPIWTSLRDWSAVRAQLMDENGLQQRTIQSRRTVSREVVTRLSRLTEAELQQLTDSSPQERDSLLWVAACRRYELLGEFAHEVVRERYLLLTPVLELDDFDSFFRGKAIWHDELDDLSVSTRTKLRQNAFRMLREAGLLSESGRILPVLLSTRVTELLNLRSPSDLRFFPMTQGGAG